MKLLLVSLILMGCAPQPARAVLHQEVIDVDQDQTVFLESLMSRCVVKMSDGRKEIIKRQVLRIAREVFDSVDTQQAYMTLLCIESRFNEAAKSPVGATGMAQLMPQYAADFSKLCGLPGVDSADLGDTETNLQLGACFFKHLLSEAKGNEFLALASYNAGASSAAVKSLKNMSNANLETANYVAKIAILRDETRGRTASEKVSNPGMGPVLRNGAR